MTMTLFVATLPFGVTVRVLLRDGEQRGDRRQERKILLTVHGKYRVLIASGGAREGFHSSSTITPGPPDKSS